MTKIIKYMVFDFDGTLADSKQIFLSLYNELAQRAGYVPITDKNLEHVRTLSIMERSRYLKIPMYRIPFLIVEFTRSYKSFIPQLQPYPGIKDLLSQLKAQGIGLAILSSNSVKNISIFLNNQDLEQFDSIISSPRLFGKHRALQKFLREKDLKPSDIIYVGDESRDIIACGKCGVDIIWVDWGYDVLETIKNTPPNHMAKSPKDILDIISTL